MSTKRHTAALQPVCPECGQTFQTKNTRQIYCSQRCVQARNYRSFKESGRYESMKRKKRERTVEPRFFQFSACPFASGAIRMPDGGRTPDANIGF